MSKSPLTIALASAVLLAAMFVSCDFGTEKSGRTAEPIDSTGLDTTKTDTTHTDTTHTDTTWVDTTHTDTTRTDTTTAPVSVSWTFDNVNWVPSSPPPACPDPVLQPPVDVNLATNILYPGQYRGTDYKVHGGFRFDNSSSNNITVKLALGGKLVRGARYIQSGEVQYMFDFVNDCGVALRYDHLLTLSDTLQTIANTLPAPQVDNSATTDFPSPQTFGKGFILASAVGFQLPPRNVAVDFGVYDYRQRNAASQDTAYARIHATRKYAAFYGVCWLGWFDSATSAKILALPGPGTEGKVSDYCK